MEFEQLKKAVTKKYPGARLKTDPRGKYYIANSQNRDIANLNIGNVVDNYEFGYEEDSLDGFLEALNSEPMIPHSKTVLGAWNNAYQAMKAHHIIGVNSDRFNPDKPVRDSEEF